MIGEFFYYRNPLVVNNHLAEYQLPLWGAEIPDMDLVLVLSNPACLCDGFVHVLVNNSVAYVPTGYLEPCIKISNKV